MSFFTMWCLADEDGRDVPASLHAAVATLEPVGPEVTERPWVSPEVLELLYGDVLPLVNGGFVCVGRA